MGSWRYSELRADGFSANQIRDGVRDGLLHRVAPGLYTDLASPPLAEKLRALRSILPTHAVFAFQTAAELYGFGLPPSPEVHVMTPEGTPFADIRGVKSHRVVLPIGDPVEVAGLPCVPPERCAVDLARTGPRIDTLAVIDAALRTGCCTPDSLVAEVARHDGLRGVRQARLAVPHGDPRSECLQESQLRFILIDGGLPPPEPQLWVPDEWGQPRYRLDMGYRERKVGVEYDGRSQYHDAAAVVATIRQALR
ncbi:type IV toxin-antitoxin system AbiEi family antitoxin domain-containing protein [Actinomycetes bacterium KLBMP 9797]